MVERIDSQDGKVGVRLRNADSETAAFDGVVIATGPWQASRLLAGMPATEQVRGLIDAYDYLPICSIYLRIPEHIEFNDTMQQLPGDGPGQWIFDRTPQGMPGSLIAVVISADGPHRRLPHQRLVSDVLGQLGNAVPALKKVTPVWSRVICEKRATFACTPDRAFPPAGRIAPHVYLAGDHTDPDYPATLEAAVRSGTRAAHAVLDDM
jgi:monoamine oxidase